MRISFRKTCEMQLSKESATSIAVEFVKKEKGADKVEVAQVEEKSDSWVVVGTFPIDMQGHPWAEKFSVAVDTKGKVKTSYFSLL
jgi:transcriptional regulatory protein LevR